MRDVHGLCSMHEHTSRPRWTRRRRRTTTAASGVNGGV